MRPDQRSLEDLEGVWPPPPQDATRLISRVHELRRVPLSKLSPEDLRLLILQQEGLDYLLPLALELLRAEPLLDAELYPGDLLSATLQVPAGYWQANRGFADQFRMIVDSIGDSPAEFQDAIRSFVSVVRRRP